MQERTIIVIIYFKGKAERYKFNTLMPAARFIQRFIDAFPEVNVECEIKPK